ncbi:MAG: RluA family pseudouridine synthase [Lachnospiraceae bacterium]|nr:RluA family pseudouridine synthase [Lachnospiraceae bacterium]
MPEILYEDKYIYVIKKPAGLPVQTASLMTKDLVSEMKNYRASKGEDPYIGLVNRLDQPVSGVLVLGKDKKTTDSLSAQIREKTAGKEYLAKVTWKEGKSQLKPGDTGELKDFLLKDGKTNTSKVVKEGTKGAKAARLTYKVLEADETSALVRVFLDTGRHHQIRVQFSNAGYPLVGDKKYGCEAGNMEKNICLACVMFSFTHPVTKKEMKFEVEPDFLYT